MFLYVPLRIPLRHCTFPFISERFSLLVNQRVIQNILILENYHKITSHVLRNKQYYSLGTEKKGFFEFHSIVALNVNNVIWCRFRVYYISLTLLNVQDLYASFIQPGSTLVKRGSIKKFYLHDEKCTEQGDK